MFMRLKSYDPINRHYIKREVSPKIGSPVCLYISIIITYHITSCFIKQCTDSIGVFRHYQIKQITLNLHSMNHRKSPEQDPGNEAGDYHSK